MKAMLINEARWIQEQLEQIDAHLLSPMLNIGSSTLDFRESVQPWINDYIFDPLHRRGVEVRHLDIMPGEGVDIVGDITVQAVIDGIARQQFRSILCSNLLEHVSDVHRICAAIEAVAPTNGHVIVTVPRRFPYHPDPIDMMFRPDLSQLLSFFPGSRCIRGAVVDCGSFWRYAKHTVVVTLPWALRRAVGLDTPTIIRSLLSFLATLFVPSQVTCVLLCKEALPDDATTLQPLTSNASTALVGSPPGASAHPPGARGGRLAPAAQR
jgi:hypothetical protein